MAGMWREERRLTHAGDALSAGQPYDALRQADGLSGSGLDARAGRVRAEAYLRLGDLAGADRALAAASRATPNDWSLHRDLAVVLLRLGRRAGAQREIARARALNPRLVLPPGFAERP